MELNNKIIALLDGRDLDKLDKPTQDLIAEIMEDSLIKKCRRDFYTFVKTMAPEILPDEFVDGRHIKYICKKLQKCYEGEIKKLQIFLPPGAMKSVLTSQLFPAWVLGKAPNKRIIAIGHGKDFAVDNLGRPTKDIMTNQIYNKIFPKTEIRHDVKAASRFTTTAKGTYVCAGAGEKIAGRRAHFAICDDVISEQDAWSDKIRNGINNWYGPGLRSRLLSKGSCEIIVNTRWHVNDLSGFTLGGAKREKRIGNWEVISVPAILEAGDPDGELMAKELGLPIGSSFWPELWPLEVLLDRKHDPSLSPSQWLALYMQRPIAEEGNIIKHEYWELWEGTTPPLCEFIVMSVDGAQSEKESADFSAYTIWGIFKRMDTDFKGVETANYHIILLAGNRGHWDYPTLKKKVVDAYRFFKCDVMLIENKASGIGLIQEYRHAGLPVVAYTPVKDKVARAHMCTPIMNSGRVHIPDVNNAPEAGAWDFVDDIVMECTQFPQAANDDYTDTVTQMIIYLRDTWKVGSADDYEEEEDDEIYKPKRKTYWNTD